MTDAEKQFLIGLEKLTRETGVFLGGCGCCDSPFLEELEKEELDARAGYVVVGDQVRWIAPDDRADGGGLSWASYNKQIVREAATYGEVKEDEGPSIEEIARDMIKAVKRLYDVEANEYSSDEDRSAAKREVYNHAALLETVLTTSPPVKEEA